MAATAALPRNPRAGTADLSWFSGATRGHESSDEQWQAIEPLLRPLRGAKGRPWAGARRVINGTLSKAKTGVARHDPPERHGPWKRCFPPVLAVVTHHTRPTTLTKLVTRVRVIAGKAYSCRSVRTQPRRRGIRATVRRTGEHQDEQANRSHGGRIGDRPPTFDPAIHHSRNVVERRFNRLSSSAPSPPLRQTATSCRGVNGLVTLLIWPCGGTKR
ncbi:transposase [Streptoalloteichus hindustanus]|uniref:transposase n=1 Tax=Streptoalloteichus hindustanus TaxID=2017 RepID=UPI00389A80E8